MKKVVALLLAICMLVTILTGCNSENNTPAETDKTQSEQQEPTSNEESKNNVGEVNKEVAVGTILDAPEVLFDADTEELYVYYTFHVFSDTATNDTGSAAIAVDQITSDTYLIYLADANNQECVYEVTDEGITKYYKDASMDAFGQVAGLSQKWELEKNDLLLLFGFFMVQDSNFSRFQFRKSDVKVVVPTGEVYVYDLMENNECVGQIGVDNATGLMVYYKDAAYEYTVQEFKTTGVEIPQYK